MSDAARAKCPHTELDREVAKGIIVSSCPTCYVAEQTAALREENARLVAVVARYRQKVLDMQASPHMIGTYLAQLLADPEGQRGEEWRALEQENESLRAVMRDVAGNCEELARMEGIEKAEQRTWQSIASRLRSVAVERARQP